MINGSMRYVVGSSARYKYVIMSIPHLKNDYKRKKEKGMITNTVM